MRHCPTQIVSLFRGPARKHSLFCCLFFWNVLPCPQFTFLPDKTQPRSYCFRRFAKRLVSPESFCDGRYMTVFCRLYRISGLSRASMQSAFLPEGEFTRKKGLEHALCTGQGCVNTFSENLEMWLYYLEKNEHICNVFVRVLLSGNTFCFFLQVCSFLVNTR